MSPIPFRVRSTVEAGRTVIVVEGELDMSTAPSLERELENASAAASRGVLLDLGECEFIDSTGIALIVKTWQRLGGDGRFALCGVADQVKRILDVTGLEAAIPTHVSREEALSPPQG